MKQDKGEPLFVNVDNPGKWDRFYFQPKFEKTGKKDYAHHCMPAGARSVPVDKDGKRMCSQVVWPMEFSLQWFQKQ